MEKKELRNYIRGLKKQYTLEELVNMSQKVWEDVEKHPKFQDANVILLYWSLSNEVYTHDFIRKWSEKKAIILPCVRGEVLELRIYKDDISLCKGESFGIMEPVGEVFAEYDKIELALIPGMAFDMEGNRLGRGKGYYDKTLKDVKNAHKIGVCFDFQFVEKVPCEEFDITMDEIIH